eukprot:1157442-Pelagomonas_calceolata.AAC.2
MVSSPNFAPDDTGCWLWAGPDFPQGVPPPLPHLRGVCMCVCACVHVGTKVPFKKLAVYWVSRQSAVIHEQCFTRQGLLSAGRTALCRILHCCLCSDPHPANPFSTCMCTFTATDFRAGKYSRSPTAVCLLCLMCMCTQAGTKLRLFAGRIVDELHNP